MRATAVLTVRNEGAFLIEWIAHHRGIGFTDFVILSNDCDDGTDKMLDRLAGMGEVHHIRNDGPYDEAGIQFTGLKLADKHEAVRGADWLLALDIDEFLNIHVGDHTLSALINALPEADAITLTWRLFGNGGLVRFRDAPVTRTFTKAAPEVMYWPWRAFMFKTLYRANGAYKKLGVHRPRAPQKGKVEQTRWFDGHGRELGERVRKQGIFSAYGREQFGLAQLNHYPLGSMENYIVKCDRGRAVHSDHALDLDYWTERNWCDVEDESIRQSDALTLPHIKRLRADEQLLTLHKEAVTWRQERYKLLMLHEDYRALMGRLMMAPPARAIPARFAKELIAFGQAGMKME